RIEDVRPRGRGLGSGRRRAHAGGETERESARGGARPRSPENRPRGAAAIGRRHEPPRRYPPPMEHIARGGATLGFRLAVVYHEPTSAKESRSPAEISAMPFTPPLRDIRFTLEEVVAVDGLKAEGDFEELTRDVLAALL